MSILEIVNAGGVGLVCLLTLVQITPLKLNPWSKIGHFFGDCVGDSIMPKVNKELDRRDAKAARYRILRFADDIRLGRKHSEEHFEEIIGDIHDYEAYCNANPDFQNGKAVNAINRVNKEYDRCLDEEDFLK